MIKKILLGLLGFVVLLLIGGYAYYRLVIYQPPLISNDDRAAIRLMPLPSKLELKSGQIDLSKGLKIRYANVKNELIEKSMERFISRLNKKAGEEVIRESGLEFIIDCQSDQQYAVPLPNEDESYTLNINSKTISLQALSPYGIIRGLETLVQLVKTENGNDVIPAVEIYDKPRFRWRGLMLDVSRHWMPKDVVLRTLDAMATVKMNVFHWHLSDDQGFRVESKVYPRLHEVGSNGKYYTQSEIGEVIRYAAERGIRVVPEFDVPGHTESWQIAYPELSTVSYPLKFGAQQGELFPPPLDPAKEEVYLFLDKLIGEMGALFPDQYLHIGGDEVNPDYWNKSSSDQEFMKENNLKDGHDFQAYFNKRVHEILQKHGKRMIGWEEILHPDLGNDIIIQSWKSHKSLFEAVQHGGTAILSSGYYLDLKLHADKHYQIDPLVLPGAVDIIPDTGYWKMYDMTMDFAGNKMTSQLVVFDRDSSNVFGFFAMMDQRMVFKNGMIKDNQITFNLNSPMGELSYNAAFVGDSINGKLAFGLLKFNTSGVQSGGSDRSGTLMPKIEIVKPLTEDEKTRIIGGEAALWSEVVSAENAESRLWPRAAAIAEKLWSPQELTNDLEDMYRRLELISKQLTEQGSRHETYYESMLHRLIEPAGFEALKTLVDNLEEVKYYNRLAGILGMDELYLPDMPLDRVVDAARPESMEAREFNIMVDAFIADSTGVKNKTEIMNQLEIWSENNERLMSFIGESEKLMEIEHISADFSLVSHAALEKLSNKSSVTQEEISQLMEKMAFLEQGDHGVLLAVVPGLRKLILK